MAYNVDVLKYTLGLDDKEFRAKAKQVDRQVGTMANSIKKNLGVMTAAFGGMFAAFQAKRLIEGLGGFIKKVTLTAARAEELDVVLEQVGKTAGYNIKYLKAQEEIIRELGITTMASRMLLIRFMQSQLDLADATKIARAAQDLAVIAQMDSSQAAETLTYAIAAQRPILLRQFGIVTDLGEVFGKYAKKINKSAEDLNDVEKRQAFLNVVLEQASRVTGTYEAAMGTAGKQMRSLPRYIQDIEIALGDVLLPTFSKVILDVTAGLKSIKRSLAEIDVEAWQKRVTSLYGAVRIELKGLVLIVEDLAEGFKTMEKAASLSLATLREMADILGIDISKAWEPSHYDILFKRMKQIYAEMYLIRKKVFEKWAEDSTQAEKTISNETLKQKLSLMQLLFQYEKINQVEYVEMLKRTLNQFKLADEQKLIIRREILDKLLSMEQTVIDAQKQMQEDYADFVAETNESMIEGALEFSRAQLELQQWQADRQREIWERTNQFQIAFYDMLANHIAITFEKIFDIHTTGAEKIKAIFESIKRSFIGILADMLAEWIRNSLIKLARHAATEKAMTAITASEVAKRAALSSMSTMMPGIGILGFIFKQGGLVQKQFGGLIEGIRSSKDNILAALSAGEFVIPRPAVERIGIPALEHMRKTGEVPARGNIHIDMGGFTFSRMETRDSFFIESSIIDTVVESVKEGIRQGKLEL